MWLGRREKEETGSQRMALVMIRTIIIGAELSFLMGGQWTHDATRSIGSRSGTVRHFLATRGTCAPIIPMGKQCWRLPTAALSRQETASPITSPETAERSTLLRRLPRKHLRATSSPSTYVVFTFGVTSVCHQ